jgi:hypothetical protein
VWGMLSDRLGRVRVIRLTLFGATAAGMISAVVPNLGILVAARALTGGLFVAVIPAALVYVGDTVGIGSRQRAVADLKAASAVGTALATVLGGLAAYLDAWRFAFAADYRHRHTAPHRHLRSAAQVLRRVRGSLYRLRATRRYTLVPTPRLTGHRPR